MLPPSPALSCCDSLDGIDDLDAFLSRQGGLSHLPTPPLNAKKAPAVEVVELEDGHDVVDDDNDDADYDHIAIILTEEASLDVAPMPDDIEKVLNILISADVPLVVVALAFNILSGLHSQEAYLGRYTDSPPGLLVVTALSLAVTCTYDFPPSTSFWSRHVCQGSWTTAHIDRYIMKVLHALDFRLHQFSLPDTLERALAGLSRPAEKEIIIETEEAGPSVPGKEPLRLIIQHTNSHWTNGQITPGQTPPCDAAFPAGNMPLTRFLPLL